MLNKYNILDQLIAYLRNKELLKKNRLQSKKILDFGCGSNFEEIKKRYMSCSKVVLIDRWGEDFADKNIKFFNYRDDFNIISQNLKDEKFDIIILAAVIEHLDKPEDIINFLKKYLDTNGYFLLTAPSKNSKWILEFMAYNLKIINADLVKEHKRYYNKNEYQILSKLTNLKLEKFYFFEFGVNTVAILK